MDLIERPNSVKRHPWELARFQVVKTLVDDQIENYVDKKILDLGCGDMFFLETFSKDKPSTEFYAVDPSFEINFPISRYESAIKIHSSIDDLPNGKDLVFDVIFLMDVIEHVRDDQLFLKNLMEYSFIGNDTLFVITAPAYQQLFCHYDRFLRHFKRYTNASLEKVTASVGLFTVDKGYFFWSLLLPRFLEKLADKLNKRDLPVKGTRLTTWSKILLSPGA